MNRDVISLEANGNICDAADCFEEATTEFVVRVGNKGTLSLDLCKKCVTKFRDAQKSRRKINCI
jgi:hypothetical protein